MYRAVTHRIEVTVEPHFLPEQSEPEVGRYFWAYTVEIRNLSLEPVQLRSRYWRITDGQGRVQEVRGAGVVGEEPVIRPGEMFHYTSGCPLSTPSGIMVGSYLMQKADGETLEVEIPAFSLDTPQASRNLN
ncbi:Co2+/Mg2+ efflux protein ApaG [Polymorphum gilvum]|uniref:Protein ApaG n=1 Tax=Polymorphum gilvum (strain LMG 25793 / CGMCC 1.9160 / SL003B-26A1) TaxID=991905 RepID=F2IY67_POLGS|nr:Co2+/Mg2+ efflux protein ApaG [Polymorphum gilvum]ADZ71679.1 hypothetical protein SL003B_3257 [Polymorphum gilvum SL003B-26A1]